MKLNPDLNSLIEDDTLKNFQMCQSNGNMKTIGNVIFKSRIQNRFSSYSSIFI